MPEARDPAGEPIAITGTGLVSAAGRGIDCFWQAVAGPRRCVAELPGELAGDLPARRGGRIPDRDLPAGEPSQRAADACRIALAEALAQGGWSEPSRCGLALGTALGAAEHLEQLVANARPGALPLQPHALTESLAATTGLAGPRSTFSATCLSSLYALEQACLELVLGRADAMLCGGVDTLSRLMQTGFAGLGALQGNAGPTGARSDLVLGEAACFVLLEPLHNARARGVPVLAVLAGRGTWADTVHLTTPDERGLGMSRAIAACLEQAALDARAVGAVSLTATASPAYARMYANVLQAVFGGHPPEQLDWEPCVGHVLAASGVLGLAHAAARLVHTIPAPADAVLALTVGFGGQNGATLVRRPDEA